MNDLKKKENLIRGCLFSSLSASLRHDILRCADSRWYQDKQPIAARGDSALNWIGCVKGAIRVCSKSKFGKESTLDYLEPGAWFGDGSLFDEGQYTHDLYAQGQTKALLVSRSDFHRLLRRHTELYVSLMKLQARQIRLLSAKVDDLRTLSLGTRLAKQIVELIHRHGVERDCDAEACIDLALGQTEIAQLVGASRQRVNIELKLLERLNVIRLDMRGIAILDKNSLLEVISAGSVEGKRVRRPTSSAKFDELKKLDKERVKMKPKNKSYVFLNDRNGPAHPFQGIL